MIIKLLNITLKAHENGRNKCQQCCARLHGPFDQFQTIRNKFQQVPTLLWFHANGRNKSQHCWARQCWVCWPTMLGPFAWAFSLLETCHIQENRVQKHESIKQTQNKELLVKKPHFVKLSKKSRY